MRTADGTPYLAPDLQLLFKGQDARPKDDQDVREVVGRLTAERRERLRRWLPDDHPWGPYLLR